MRVSKHFQINVEPVQICSKYRILPVSHTALLKGWANSSMSLDRHRCTTGPVNLQSSYSLSKVASSAKPEGSYNWKAVKNKKKIVKGSNALVPQLQFDQSFSSANPHPWNNFFTKLRIWKVIRHWTLYVFYIKDRRHYRIGRKAEIKCAEYKLPGHRNAAQSSQSESCNRNLMH